MGLLNKAKVSQLIDGIHPNVMINKVDTKTRKGKNGPINKIIYITLTQLDAEKKRKAEAEVGWWKPDATNDFFKTNLQELCIQLHNILSCFMTEDEAFDVFAGIFEGVGITKVAEIESKSWKKSEVDTLLGSLADTFKEAITPYIGNSDELLYLKLATNYKGEDIEIPKYGKFVEPMSIGETTLKFTDAELKNKSKAGNVTKKAAAVLSSGVTI
jgi:hypothetical protein